MAQKQQQLGQEAQSIHDLSEGRSRADEHVKRGLTESCEVTASEMAASSFGKAIPSVLNDGAQRQEAPNIRADGYVATHVGDDGGPALYDPSKGVYQLPHTREVRIVGTMAAPGTGVEDNAKQAGINPAEGANERPGKLEYTAADESRLSSRIINAQGYTTPPPSELQNEELTASRTTKNDFPSVKEFFEQLKLSPSLFDRVDEKAIDLIVKFGKRDVGFAGRVPVTHTSKKPTMYLRKHGIVTAEDVYLLLLIGVDLTNSETPMYLQWMVQDVRLPSGSPEVDVVSRLGREMAQYKAYGRAGGLDGHVFLLYQQQKPLPSNIRNGIEREGFAAKAFIKSVGLKHPHPVLAFYYETE